MLYYYHIQNDSTKRNKEEYKKYFKKKEEKKGAIMCQVLLFQFKHSARHSEIVSVRHTVALPLSYRRSPKSIWRGGHWGEELRQLPSEVPPPRLTLSSQKLSRTIAGCVCGLLGDSGVLSPCDVCVVYLVTVVFCRRVMSVWSTW